MQTPKPNFPFSAVTGQKSFKLALTLVAVNPAIGGVLVSGPRGSAKSTLAKGLADVMPEVAPQVVDPTELPSMTVGRKPAFVNLPLSVTEEMVVGTLNLQQVLSEKQVAFQEGLLAKANNGILYVDEVNLLQDSIVDLLLDVAASGVNVVERDGISHSHDAKFILLGTMNPDEGELRPQLQDRFGLAVELGHEYDIAERIEIVQRREAYDTNWQAFLTEYQEQQTALKNAILATRSFLQQVECPLAMQELIANKCHAAQVDGLRADIVWYRAALTHAAVHKRLTVTIDDINAVEELVLSHRRQNRSSASGPSSPGASSQKPPSQEPHSQGTAQTTRSAQSHDEARQKPFSRPPAKPTRSDSPASSGEEQQADGDWGAMDPQQLKTADSINIDLSIAGIKQPQSLIKRHSINTAGKVRNRSGNPAKSILSSQVASKEQGASGKVNWLSSLLASAGQWPLQQLKFYQTQKTQMIVHLVLIDTSASTLKNELFSQAKGIILSISEQAYIAREQLSIIGFGNQNVETLLPRQRAPKELRTLLDTIPAAGGTPLREALETAEKFHQQHQRQTPGIRIKTYIITDGKTRQSVTNIDLGNEVTLIDIEQSTVKRGKGQHIAQNLHASYRPLFNL